MIAHRHEQIKEQFAANLHFHLHGSASLERLATPNDQSKVMSAQSRVRVWRIVIRIPSGSQDHVDGDSTLQALLAKRKPLELLQAVLLGSTVDSSIPEDNAAYSRMKNCGLARPAATGSMDILGVLELPRGTALVVYQAWIIVTLVEKLENTGNDLRFSA